MLSMLFIFGNEKTQERLHILFQYDFQVFKILL